MVGFIIVLIFIIISLISICVGQHLKIKELKQFNLDEALRLMKERNEDRMKLELFEHIIYSDEVELNNIYKYIDQK